MKAAGVVNTVTVAVDCAMEGSPYGINIAFLEDGRIRIQTRGDSRYWKEFKDAHEFLLALQQSEKFTSLTTLLK